LLAAALRGDGAAWPIGWSGSEQAGRTIERIGYHGIAGLIAEQASRLVDWPGAVLAWVREQAIALAMWELRHKEIVADLLAALAEERVAALLLKGSALAYDLYSAPATRARGDSDVLIAAADLDPARAILARRGFRCQPRDEAIADDLALQEVWSILCPAGTKHHVDLHWQLINAPALHGILDFERCARQTMPLPRLGHGARTMRHPLTLLHTCIHRAMHLTSPYFVDGVTYYGGDRLIWAKDIELLSRSMTEAEWCEFTAIALDQGVAAVCLDGLQLAERTLGATIADGVFRQLGTAVAEPASAYLIGSGQARRAWLDLRAIPGLRRKLAYVAARSVPTGRFMRDKYPGLSDRPLAVLHLQRLADLIRPRPRDGKRR